MLCALAACLVPRDSWFVKKKFSFAGFILTFLCNSVFAEEMALLSKQQQIFEEAKGFTETLLSSKTVPHALRDTLFHEPRKPNHETRILIFVSFSMGDTALHQYAQAARKAGASLVFRGLIGDSLKTTALRLQTLAQKTQAHFLIDPTLFRNFGIEKVPAVVVTSSLHEPRIPDPEPRSFDVVYGLTTLDYTLEKIAREGETGNIAETALQKLRSQS